MVFPKIRLRRLRSSDAMRRLVRETTLSVDNLVYPLFVREGKNIKEPIKSMTDCFHFSPDTVADEAAQVASLGIPAVLLFGLPKNKDEMGSQAWSEDGVVQLSIKAIKKRTPELLVITDICLCEYTSHGHCGVVKDGKIDNDSTCELLAKVALSHAQAGADIVAPSDMMDGRVRYIREALEENGFYDVAIMSYAAKYASAFYGPFRDAAESAPAFGDRKTYQMDPANARQALAEIALDIEEGADIVMVKPALCFLDVIYRAKQRFDCPIAAYNVSGEYMMLNTAAEKGLLDKQAAMLEMLTSIKRAGADIIITYFAKEAAKQCKSQNEKCKMTNQNSKTADDQRIHNAEQIYQRLLNIPIQEVLKPNPDVANPALDLNVRVWNQAMLCRVRELGGIVLELHRQDKALSSAILTRALLETVALYYHIFTAIKNALETNNIDQAIEKLWRVGIGSRSGGIKGYKAIEIKQFVKELYNLNLPARQSYRQLSEMTHPNFSGVAFAYTEPEQQTLSFKFTKDFEHIKTNYGYVLEFALAFFEIHYAEMNKLINEFMKLLKR